MKKIVISAVALWFVVACGKQAAEQAVLEKARVPEERVKIW